MRPGPGSVPQPRDEHEVLAPGEDLVDGGVLPGEADRGAYLRGVAQDVVAVHLRRAGVGSQQGGEDLYQGGLSGSVGAERARMWPVSTVRSTPRSTCRRSKDFVTPRTSIATGAGCVLMRERHALRVRQGQARAGRIYLPHRHALETGRA